MVSGVLARRSHGAFFGTEIDTVVLMPVATKRAKLQPTSPGLVQRLLVKARSESAVDAAKSQAAEGLRQRHNLRDSAPDDFRIRSDDAFRQAQENILSVLRTLLTSVAAISLFVGGIGIMNITLVSVTERTREIGLRMAIGATRLHILLEFLIESVLLSLIGGALGVVLSVFGTSALGKALSLPIEPSADALLSALVVSIGIGAVFGLVPAWRAASLDPIAALGRSEAAGELGPATRGESGVPPGESWASDLGTIDACHRDHHRNQKMTMRPPRASRGLRGSLGGNALYVATG